MLNRTRRVFTALLLPKPIRQALRGDGGGGGADRGRRKLLPGQRPEEFLSIPIRDMSEDDEACRDAQRRGQFLARQDMWEELAEEIAEADGNRETTPAGMPVADLLAWGARADVVRAVEHALVDESSPQGDAPLVEGIRGLEAVRAEMPDNPWIALVVALAHIDIGWAWRGPAHGDSVPGRNRKQFAAHFDRAAELLAPHRDVGLSSPAMAAARCAVLAGRRDPRVRLADDYENLIDLDPHNYRHMRALGNHMLPRWFGSYTELEIEARRIAARTQHIWGAGGYAWVNFDAIAIDEGACARVDVDFFLDGLRDIIAARPEQAMVNLLTAYCSVAIRKGEGRDPQADLQRERISAAASWLIRDHLTELHPMIWAHAADGFDNSARITSPSRFAARGRADALRIIADQFRDDIERGHLVVFSADGPELRRV